MKKKLLILALSISSLFFLANCKEKNRFKIDLKKHSIETTIIRFDKALTTLDTTQTKREVERLYWEYPDFMPIFIEEILLLSPKDTLFVAEYIEHFLSDTTFQKVNTSVLTTFDDISLLEKKISTAYSYIGYYFPKTVLPELYFFVSGLNSSLVQKDKALAVGADLYLGADYPLYSGLTYNYLTQNMKEENIPSDLIFSILVREFPMEINKGHLLEHMLHNGKIMFLLSTFLPTEEPENLIGYRKEELNWCRKNELNIWSSIIDKKHLFSSDSFLIRQYMNEAPFTSPVSQDSPGRLGVWVGWQIITSYMKNNKDISLVELMKEKDPEKILQKSGYRP